MMAEALEPGELRVGYAFSSELGEHERARCKALLSDDELARHARLRFETDQDAYLAAHALTRSMLGRALGEDPRGLRFELGEHGRPELAGRGEDPRLRFNLSHTRGLVACVLALEHDVGVDVEQQDRRVEIDLVANNVFSPRERRELDALGEAERRARFFELWTLKEAYLKAIGKGLTLSLKSISIELPAAAPPRIAFEAKTGDRSERWFLRLARPHPGFVLAVAASAGEGHTRCDIVELAPWT